MRGSGRRDNSCRGASRIKQRHKHMGGELVFTVDGLQCSLSLKKVFFFLKNADQQSIKCHE